MNYFRGGFDEFFGPDQIVEVDLPGLTSPMLTRFEWQRLPARSSRSTIMSSGGRRPATLSSSDAQARGAANGQMEGTR
jgi:hypothetical protein